MSTSIHLCQPATHLSCAACCGIYNHTLNTRDELDNMFARRERLFEKVRRGSSTIEAYQEALRRTEISGRIYQTIYTCEFAGYVSKDHRRVGCMIHPAANNGNDLRSISFYGREICDGHFCPSYSKLEDNEAMTIIACLDDWYLYGAVITDIDFVKTFFRIAQDRLGESVDASRVSGIPDAARAVRDYCELKVAWPFRDTSRPRFGKYYFTGEEYDIARIDYKALGAEPSPFDAILLSLASSFNNKDELEQAHLIIEGIIEDFRRAYERLDG